jgi:hypothetical protein
MDLKVPNKETSGFNLENLLLGQGERERERERDCAPLMPLTSFLPP